jgi:hypothetical protein
MLTSYLHSSLAWLEAVLVSKYLIYTWDLALQDDAVIWEIFGNFGTTMIYLN